ncbi:MAG: FAD binding domain-containing protein, partial [Deltaproteobacteria bacterium]|nr:FAD binding domain-containing protein [Deltaproteobacteria bacterium]
LGLDQIQVGDAGLVIGACCTIQALLESDAVFTPIHEAARNIVNRHVRNVATVGGQIGANDTWGDLLPALVALEASVALVTPAGDTSVPVECYLAGPPAGLIARVRIPIPAPKRSTGVRNYAATATDESLVTAAASLTRERDVARNPIVAVGGVANHVMRLEAVEQALDGRAPPNRDEIEKLVAAAVSPPSDHRGSAAYRKHLAGVIVASAIQAAWQGVR